MDYRVKKARRKLKILVAEDNAVNQNLILHLLKKRGHRAALASNGTEVLNVLEKRTFDVVLMDVQMPEMSGLEATQRIREKEKGFGKHVPIVAMTAHAMKGDRERCLEAGMDSYVAKPIRPKELFREIERWAGGAAPPERVSTASEKSTEGFSIKDLLVRFDGNAKLLLKLIRIFLEDTDRMMSAIQNALTQHDENGLARASHTLKGSVANFGARPMVDSLRQLEEAGRKGNLKGADETYARLEQEMALFVKSLRELESNLARKRKRKRASMDAKASRR